MLMEFDELYERLETLHKGIKEALRDLPQEALDWVPGPEMNSLGILVMHTAGAERYWIGDVIGEDPSGRVRETEFQVKGLDAQTLMERLDDTLFHSRGILQELSLEDLSTIRTSPRDGREFSVAWSMAHALEHTALHLGHIQIIRQLWDQKNTA